MNFFHDYQGIKTSKKNPLKIVPLNEDKAYKITYCKVTPDCSVWQVQKVQKEAIIHCPEDQFMFPFRIQTSPGFCVKYFLANRRLYNWQPIHQSFMLRITIEPIGHLAG